MNFVCDVCDKTYVTHLENTKRCYTCETSEMYWREKISQEINDVWQSYPLKDYYNTNLAIKILAEYIRKGKNASL
jgi:hypothetical protein